MGLSFHYSGRIAQLQQLNNLITEVEDIVKVFNWKYHIYERQFPENNFGEIDYNDKIYGISFTPPESETVSISFLSNGRMSDPAHLAFYGKTETRPESQFLYTLSVKTQYAGPEIHQLIMQLFRYISNKYLTSFNMEDEGGYWESNNIDVLNSNFAKYTSLINSFVSAVESFPTRPGETMDDYFKRLLKWVNNRKK
jgi:hypothetical protein